MATPPDLDYFDKVNYVIDAWTQACEAPWYIYVSTLKPALLAAFITLITFGWDDVLRGYARPPDRHARRRTGKKRGKGKIGIRGIPEFGEAIGRQLPGSQEVKGINWSNGLRTLWRIDSVAQMALFWWLVADVTIDFGFNWTSLLYETRWCQDSSRGRFSFQKGTASITPPDAWNTIAYNSSDYSFPFPNWIITFGITGVKGATISYSIDWEPFNPLLPPTSYQSRLVDIDTGEVWSESGETQPDLNDKAVNIASADLPGSRRFAIQGKSAGFHGRIRDGVVIGIENLL